MLGFGIYFLLQQYNLISLANFFTWPTLFIICGLGFLAKGYIGKVYDFILPGVILTGLGIHYHVAANLDAWPNDAGILLLLISLGILLKYVKTGTEFLQGILFLSLSLLLLFVENFIYLLNINENTVNLISYAWPFIFVIFGVYYLIRAR